MHLTMKVAAAILAFGTVAVADQCSQGSTLEGGNYYCAAVKAIQYKGIGTPGTYQQITEMREDGTCSSVPKSFSGPLSPLDEEVGPALNWRLNDP